VIRSHKPEPIAELARRPAMPVGVRLHSLGAQDRAGPGV